jgi:hypothetical protein
VDKEMAARLRPDAGTSNIYVDAQLSGAFQPLGGGVLSALPGKTDATLPVLAIDPYDRPVVAWQEFGDQRLRGALPTVAWGRN